MKKLGICILSCMMVFCLVGCDKQLTLNTEENDLIAEYIAGVMLKYSFSDKWNYEKASHRVDAYQIKDPSSLNGGGATSLNLSANTEPTTSSQASNATTSAVGGSQNVKDNTQTTEDVLTSMISALGLNGIDVKYKTYSVGDRYPTEEYAICVSASEGFKVLAVEFELTNNTDSAVTVNTTNKGVLFRLNTKDRTLTQYATMLKNDLVYLDNVTIDSGSSYSAVVVFQVPLSSADNLTAATLSVYQNGTSIGQVLSL